MAWRVVGDMKFNSLKDIIEQQVRSAFEKDVEHAMVVLREKHRKEYDEMIESQTKKAKHMANSLALEMMQKMNCDGISLELKV